MDEWKKELDEEDKTLYEKYFHIATVPHGADMMRVLKRLAAARKRIAELEEENKEVHDKLKTYLQRPKRYLFPDG
jgi:hypothetical protein